MVRKILKISGIFFVLMFSTISSIYALSPQSSLKYEGIDVSDWQGYIDYSQVKNSGIEIVYIKSSQGRNIKDPYFEINYKNARANNLKIGFYHYMTATNIQEAEEEAMFFSSVISGKKADCKLVLDYEQFGGINNYEINLIAQAFINKVKEITKKQVILYSDLSNTESTFNSELASQVQLWIAYYENYKNLERVNSNWNSFIGVQYTDSGIVPGINGYVDRDLYTDEIFLDDNSEMEFIEIPQKKYNTETINYTVRIGDTLSSIASFYGTTVSEIANINGITNVNLIFPGQILQITTNSNNPGGETHSTGKTYYTVKRGDTLWGISIMYGITVDDLVKWNNIQNRNLIYPGQRLILYGAYSNKYNTNNVSKNNNFDVMNFNKTARVTYIVQKWDTIGRIARRFRTCPRRIARINGITSSRQLYIGQELKIF